MTWRFVIAIVMVFAVVATVDAAPQSACPGGVCPNIPAAASARPVAVQRPAVSQMRSVQPINGRRLLIMRVFRR